MSNISARIPRAWKGAGIALACAGLVTAGLTHAADGDAATSAAAVSTTTPIKHVVVLFDENETFDHYFGTYPNVKYPMGAAQAGGDGSAFTKSATAPRTSDGQALNNYVGHPDLLTNNPNSVAPFRLTHEQAWTCSQNHSYAAEQKAVDGGAMDKFPESVSRDTCTGSGAGPLNTAGETMGYYDGNTVTGLWNYAQRYAMSENNWADTFGPSTVGALNLVSGQTHGAKTYASTADVENPTPVATPADNSAISANDANGVGTVIGDPDPVYDDCADLDHTSTSNLAGMADTNKNVGDLLNDKGVSWGYFAGGFNPTTPWNGTAGTYAKCDALSSNLTHTLGFDYNPHHNPFAYYKSTSNPHHYPGTPGVAIGTTDPTNDTTKTGANHQYDLGVFYDALENNQLPSVSYVKAIYAEDGHPANSDPLDEQRFLTRTVNAVMQSPEWSTTAIIIAYDDSDGWYDHQAPTIINGSSFTGANVDNQAVCTSATNAAAPLGGYQDRCGPSQRLPLVVISPFAKRNYVSNTPTTQSSILKFVEDNFSLAQVGDSSFDASAGSLNDMFDFAHPRYGTTLLRADGTIKGATKASITLKATHTKVVGGKTTVTVTATLGAGYYAVGKVHAVLDGKTIATKTLSSTGKAVWSGLKLPKAANTLVFSMPATDDTNAATLTIRINR
ncbi:phospholipase C [Nocardioides ultimimeridianus]